ncbi:TnpA family transposase [Streptomyces griseochromogenes]|uniref:TnpA family transposase n=1 Tax=Streptomyces griseochromogenes TaxID=68214 RepID=A0A1B1B4I5_9ACTN|nr:Tn3 family transposase [Streptomyces griseochromogenes]ANP53733.1 hypothetical protein AVL59_33005 [Streptomyces griseochromogenes]MBP2054971.1 TnpA family transposase [Streptomyces griseochromogenes]
MHWPDMLRLAGALITNQVRAYDLLRMFGREGHPTPLGAAFAEYGRIDKTMHLLALADPMDDTYRRLMNRQLTVQESRNFLGRYLFNIKAGDLGQALRPFRDPDAAETTKKETDPYTLASDNPMKSCRRAEVGKRIGMLSNV